MKKSVRQSTAKVKKQAASAALPDTGLLLTWYDRHRRVMPWRALPQEAVDPYRVWLSEIMLQQTTVAAVGPYFQRFIKRWPTLNDLAQASLDDVLRMWAGLGYYRRARMLHKCAEVLHTAHRGTFPRAIKELLDLPGFGPYTAAAVAAIAFGQKANVVDGNVERVMARIFAITDPLPKVKPKLRLAAELLLPETRCGDYAQALMDLGAVICTPRAPKCSLCPWQSACAAHALGIQETLPRRVRKQSKPTRRAIAFVALNSDGQIFLRQRPPTGLLAGMMEVPSTPWNAEMPALDQALSYAPKRAKWVLCEGQVTHVFTHFTLEIRVAYARIRPKGGLWIAPDKLSGEALPSLMKKIIHHALKAI